MKTLSKIIQYCPDCNKKRTFEYIGDSKYKIILKKTPTTEEKNKKIILRSYACNKCGLTIDSSGYDYQGK